MREMTFYGTGLPGLEREPYSGKLIVVEGTDGVGRSTHITLLRSWLESRGHAVLERETRRCGGERQQEAKTARPSVAHDEYSSHDFRRPSGRARCCRRVRVHERPTATLPAIARGVVAS